MPGLAFRSSTPTATIPTGITVGDFNRDGHLDWIVASGGEGTLWLYLGRGDGTYETPTAIWAGGKFPDWVQAAPGGPSPVPVWVASADFRKNGILDLVVGEGNNTGSVAILMGNGDGTFQPAKRLSVLGTVAYSAVADFNGDGKPDLLIGILNGGLKVFAGDGLGNFSSGVFQDGFPSYSGPIDPDDFIEGLWPVVGIGDFDGDGVLDVAYAGPGGGWVLRGIGNGQFIPIQELIHQMTCLHTCEYYAAAARFVDADEDGYLDYVVVDNYGVGKVFKNNQDGTFAKEAFATFGVGNISADMAIADLNHDGHLDVITSGLYQPIPYGYGDDSGNLLSVSYGDGRGHFSDARVFRGGSHMIAIAIGDLNEDGSPDVITADQFSDTFTMFLNDGHGGFGGPQGRYFGWGGNGPSNSPNTGLSLADVDGDGRPDVSFIELPPPGGKLNLNVSLNQGNGSFAAPVRTALPVNFRADDFVLGDFRNIGKPDLLASLADSSNTEAFRLYFAPNLGGGHFGNPVSLDVTASQLEKFASADLNGDGKLDYVRADIGRIYIANGNGDGTFGAEIKYLYPGVAEVGDLNVVDVNADGHPDILVRVQTGIFPPTQNALFEFINKGDGTFQPAKTLFSNFDPFSVADVNRDGLPDLITTAIYSNPVVTSIYMGQPDGNFVLSHAYPGISAAGFGSSSGIVGHFPSAGPLLGDFNHDGNTDVAVREVIQNQHFIQFLAGNGDGSFTPTNNIYDTFHTSPQFVADMDGDGLSDLIEEDKFTSSFHYVPGTQNPPAMQMYLDSPNPVRTNASINIVLNQALPFDQVVTLSLSGGSLNLPGSISFPAGTSFRQLNVGLSPGADPSKVVTIQGQIGTKTASVLVSAPFNPFPTLKQFFQPIIAGDPGFTMTVAGYEFVPGCVARLDGVGMQTVFISDQQLQVTIPSSDLAIAGPRGLTVWNPGPGGGESNRANMYVEANVVNIGGLSPASVLAGTAALKLSINGGIFTPQSVVRWNGNNRPTTFVDRNNLSIDVAAADIANVGEITITVFDPRQGGLLSAAAVFSIRQAGPPVGAVEVFGNAFTGNRTFGIASSAKISGWAASPSGSSTLRVLLKVNGVGLAGVRTGESRPDIAAAKARPDWINSGWSSFIYMGNSPGTYTLTADAVDDFGNTTPLPITGGGTFTIVRNPLAVGALDSIQAEDGSLTVMQGGRVYLSGWAADSAAGAPANAVQVYLGDILHPVGLAKLGIARPDVVSSTGKSNYLLSGFQYDFNIGNISLGPHYVMAQAFTPTGDATPLNPGGNGATTLINVVAPSPYLSPHAPHFLPTILRRSSAVMPMTLVNPTNSPVFINQIQTTGEFLQSNNCLSVLGPGQKCDLRVGFTPAAIGVRNGSLTVNTSSGKLTSALVGNGVDFSLALARPARSSRAVSQNSIRAGETASVELSVDSGALAEDHVSLTCSAAIPDASCVVEPPSVILNGTEVPIAVRIKTLAHLPHRAARLRSRILPVAGTPPGQYKVVVTATVGDNTKTIEIPIQVQ